MDGRREMGLIESVLFLESEPLEVSSLCRITGLSREAVQEAIRAVQEEYSATVHGIELTEIGGGYAFVPKQAFWEELKNRYGKKNEAKLSKAALETLSIIAYSQPITRAEIEGIRGVSADGMIKLLLDRNMIKEVGKKEAPSRPILYGTTKEFLKLFRLSSIADLPKLDELDKERFESNE